MFEKIVGSIGDFSYRNRKAIAVISLILFVCVSFFQSQTAIEYSYAEESLVTDIFPQDDTLVMVYDNADEAQIEEIIRYLEQDEHVTSIQCYANTLGAQMSPGDLAGMMGIPEAFVNTLFYIHEYGMEASGMTLREFVGFLSSDDFLNNELFASMLDEGAKAQIGQLKAITDALASDTAYTADEIADMLGVEEQLVKSVFYIAQLKNVNIFNITETFWSTVADALGMDSATIEKIFGVAPVERMQFTEFVDIVSTLAKFAKGIVDAQQLSQLSMLEDMAKMIENDTALDPDDIAELFSAAADNEMFTESNINLLYILARSNTVDLSEKKIPLYALFLFLSEDILTNEAFAPFFDESMLVQFEEAKVTIEDGKAQLIGEDHARMMITLDYKLESKEINAFYENLTKKLDDTFSKEYYLIGTSAMSYEVAQSFRDEFVIISIVTAIVVFIVVWFTFKNFLLSLLLICIIECAVFAMMSVMVAISTPMFFIALILVQCILMGSMIDYGILFTSYYTEVRKEFPVETALPETMKRATHAILTSSLIIILVTLICGRLLTGAVATILTTLGIGALCAILLILFALPSLLVIFDKPLFGPKEKKKEEIDPFDD